ncbi:Hydroxypyruvate reductase [Baekduia alba]|uniref:C-terminal binding protein n=1 Tax=Baekduia alba TaxID=2997333 RepID=UPI00234054B5|nr:C-terminal binding protein [Baekduia alba]WCB93305.1 Hydroxypyruvate reductase [Baekduia alba]
MKVLITDITWADTAIEDEVLARVGAETVLAETGEEDELVELVRDADAILTCFAQVTPRVIAAGERLRVVGRYGVGTDNIAVDAATRRGVPVTNVPVYCTDEVAEHVLGMLLALVRGFALYDRAVRAGDWALGVGLPTRRVAGSTLGVVGFGAIGQTVARKAQGLDMKVIAHDADEGRVRDAGVEPVSLAALARRADAISVHVPLLNSTRHLVDAEFLKAMKPTAYLLNAARGAIVDLDALADALAAGTIAGAGIDVFEPERLPADHPLLQQDRLLATPHTAFYSEESMRDLARHAAENVAAVLRGEQPAATVNREALAAAS